MRQELCFREQLFRVRVTQASLRGGARPSAPGAQSNNFGVSVLWKVLEYIKCVSNVQGNLRLVAISGDCFALPLTAITRYVAQVTLTWKPPLSESSKASEIESKETFRTSP